MHFALFLCTNTGGGRGGNEVFFLNIKDIFLKIL